MRKFENFKNRVFALVTTGIIGLTSITGCTAKTNTDDTTAYTTVPSASITTTLEPTTTPTTEAVVSQDVATEDYRIHARAVAKAMYANNKAYFDKKQFTEKDLENLYYIANDKPYDAEMNQIMEKDEYEKALRALKELIMPQRVNELMQGYSDYQNGFVTKEQFDKAVAESEFYNYAYSLSNFFDVNPNNKDVREFIDAYCKEMIKVTTDLQTGSKIDKEALEKHMIEFFSLIRKDQNGTNKNRIQETTTKFGESLTISYMDYTWANFLNTVINGQYVNVDGEKVRVGVSYDEGLLLKALAEGRITETKYVLEGEKIKAELFQTAPYNDACANEDASREMFNQPSNKKVLTR